VLNNITGVGSNAFFPEMGVRWRRSWAGRRRVVLLGGVPNEAVLGESAPIAARGDRRVDRPGSRAEQPGHGVAPIAHHRCGSGGLTSVRDAAWYLSASCVGQPPTPLPELAGRVGETLKSSPRKAVILACHRSLHGTMWNLWLSQSFRLGGRPNR
jgi:hypothetical protein